jgi:hypothetical protein
MLGRGRAGVKGVEGNPDERRCLPVMGDAPKPPRPPTVLVAFRVPPALAERLDRIVAELSAPWHEMKRSEVARAAMERGLDALEQEIAEKKGEEPGRGS